MTRGSSRVLLYLPKSWAVDFQGRRSDVESGVIGNIENVPTEIESVALVVRHRKRLSRLVSIVKKPSPRITFREPVSPGSVSENALYAEAASGKIFSPPGDFSRGAQPGAGQRCVPSNASRWDKSRRCRRPPAGWKPLLRATPELPASDQRVESSAHVSAVCSAPPNRQLANPKALN